MLGAAGRDTCCGHYQRNGDDRRPAGAVVPSSSGDVGFDPAVGSLPATLAGGHSKRWSVTGQLCPRTNSWLLFLMPWREVGVCFGLNGVFFILLPEGLASIFQGSIQSRTT